MQGFINRRIPLFLRRLITMLPALLLIGIGVNPSRALVISQVVLSFGIPFALVPLVLFCRNGSLMDRSSTGARRRLWLAIVAAVIISLNLFLLEQTFFG